MRLKGFLPGKALRNVLRNTDADLERMHQYSYNPEFQCQKQP